jgi:hypothetical protein
MPWPVSQDYNEAIQNAASNFAEAELRAGEVVTDALGLPRPCSGNFADVYQVCCPQTGNRWAVKCFTRPVGGLQERYRAISAFLPGSRLPFIIEFEYLEKGIRVGGMWYPIVKMPWVEGLTLNTFIRDSLEQPALLEALGQLWLRMARRLRRAGAAHGDLQHGNVLLVPGRTPQALALRLIDYDGMYVPALASIRSGELGHPNYQHPLRLRQGLYGPDVDRFGLLVVAAALRCLLIGGRPLWQRYDTGDNLLFTQKDFASPHQSPLFAELLQMPDRETRSVAARLMAAAQKPLEQTPLLEEVFGDAFTKTPPPPSRRTPTEPISTVLPPPPAPARRYPPPRGPRTLSTRQTVGFLVLALGLLAIVVWVAFGLPLLQQPKVAGPNAGVQPPQAPPPANPPPAGNGGPAGPPAAPQAPAQQPPPGAGPEVNGDKLPLLLPRRPDLDPGHGPPLKAGKPQGDAPKPDANPKEGQAPPANLPSPLDHKGAHGPKEKQPPPAMEKDKAPPPPGDADLKKEAPPADVPKPPPPTPEPPPQAAAEFKHPPPAQPRQWEAHPKVGRISGIALSAKEDLLLVGGEKGLALLDMTTGKEAPFPVRWKLEIQSVAFSHDGAQIAAADNEQIYIWDLQTGTQLQKPFAEKVEVLLLHGASKRVFSAARDGTRKIWSTETWTDESTIGKPGRKGRAVLAISDDGTKALYPTSAGGMNEDQLELWDIKDGKIVKKLPGHPAMIRAVAFSPSGNWAASAASDKTLRLWDLESEKQIACTNVDAVLWSLAFADDQRLIGGDEKGALKLWDVAEDAKIQVSPNAQSGSVIRIGW